jgi:hypothetical protein
MVHPSAGADIGFGVNTSPGAVSIVASNLHVQRGDSRSKHSKWKLAGTSGIYH